MHTLRYSLPPSCRSKGRKSASWMPGLAAFLLLSHCTAFAQGSLTPPGAPAPTMRTLPEIEPRTPISSLPFAISNSGAYYLAGNLTGTDGIYITTDNVDLDLHGFTLNGPGSSGSGISVSGSQQNVTIHDGIVANWGGFGVDASNVNNGHLEKLRASGNGQGGLIIGASSLISHCEANANSGDGISAGEGSIVRDCVARTNGVQGGNSGGSGIVCGLSALVSACSATFNFDFGISVGHGSSVGTSVASQNGSNPLVTDPTHKGAGIKAANGCSILGCTANANYGAGAFDAFGIYVGNGCTVKDCTTISNSGGIFAGDNCQIQACQASYSQGNAPGEGIRVGNNCTVRGCTLNSNTYFNLALGDGCFAERNTCLGAVAAADATMGSRNAFVNNKLTGFNGFKGGLSQTGISNAVGTIDSFSTFGTNKNPHANIIP